MKRNESLPSKNRTKSEGTQRIAEEGGGGEEEIHRSIWTQTSKSRLSTISMRNGTPVSISRFADSFIPPSLVPSGASFYSVSFSSFFFHFVFYLGASNLLGGRFHAVRVYSHLAATFYGSIVSNPIWYSECLRFFIASFWCLLDAFVLDLVLRRRSLDFCSLLWAVLIFVFLNIFFTWLA